MTFKSVRRKPKPLKPVQKLSYRSKSTAYEKFLNAINTPETKKTYIYHLKNFLEFANLSKCTGDNRLSPVNYAQLLEIPDRQKTDLIEDFIDSMKKRGLAYQTINTATAAVKLFYDQNGVEQLGWKRLAKQKGKRKAVIKDRTYTDAELKQLLEHADLRERVMILLLLSSGIRIGALAGLKKGDLTYFPQDKHYMIRAYSEDIGEDYFTFCTPECALEIDKYFKFREEKEGETLTKNSPVITHKITSTRRFKNKGFLSSKALQKILERQRYDANVMKATKLTTKGGPSFSKTTTSLGRIRKEVMRSHGFRKIFNTKCMDLAIYPPYKEALMGHHLGLDKSYWRPENQEKIRQEYLKVVDALTIDDAHRLQLQNVQLHKEVEEIQQLKQQMKEKDKAFDELYLKFGDAAQDAYYTGEELEKMKGEFTKVVQESYDYQTYTDFELQFLRKELEKLKRTKKKS